MSKTTQEERERIFTIARSAITRAYGEEDGRPFLVRFDDALIKLYDQGFADGRDISRRWHG